MVLVITILIATATVTRAAVAVIFMGSRWRRVGRFWEIVGGWFIIVVWPDILDAYWWGSDWASFS